MYIVRFTNWLLVCLILMGANVHSRISITRPCSALQPRFKRGESQTRHLIGLVCPKRNGKTNGSPMGRLSLINTTWLGAIQIAHNSKIFGMFFNGRFSLRLVLKFLECGQCGVAPVYSRWFFLKEVQLRRVYNVLESNRKHWHIIRN